MLPPFNMLAHVFQKTFLDGVSLEVKRAGDGYTAAKVRLGRLPRKELPEVLLILDQIAARQLGQ